jgi:hypothetical protein
MCENTMQASPKMGTRRQIILSFPAFSKDDRWCGSNG